MNIGQSRMVGGTTTDMVGYASDGVLLPRGAHALIR